MKKILLYLVLIFIVNISFGQTIINLTPSDNINDTLNYLQSAGLTENVTINLSPGTYNQYIEIQDIGTDVSKQITIKSTTNNADDVIIQPVGGDAITIMDGYINIKNITINGLGNTAVKMMVDQAKAISNKGNVIIDSCKINADISNSYYAIEFSGSMGMSDPVDNIRITNCLIHGGNTGIYFSPQYSMVTNLVIDNNIFEGQKINNVYFDFYMNYVNNLIFTNNVINLPYNYSSYNNTVGVYLTGISNDINSGNGKTEISNNSFLTNIDTVNYNPLNISNCSGHDGGFIISNNFINIENTDSVVVGINIEYSDSIKILHNSIKLLSKRATGIYYKNTGGATPKNLILKNNIIQSDSVCIKVIDAISDDFNNNIYYSPYPNSAFNCEGNDFNISTWSGMYSVDDNSSFEDPYFVSYGDPHYNNLALDNVAPKLVDVDYDIDSLTRNSPNCDPGAKEIMFVDLGHDTTICYGEVLDLTAPTGVLYTWNTGETTQNITVSSTGTYSVTVQETSGGPIGIDTIDVVVNPEIIVQLSDYTDVTCFGQNNGMLELNVSGGLAPYSYTWLGSFLDTNKIENLTAAQYDVNISDANLCFVDTFFVVSQPDSIEIIFDSPKFCGGCTGFIVPSVIGGTEPYNYSWSSGTTDTIATDLCEGTYTLTIVDDSLCIATDSYSIVQSNLAYISGTLSYSGGNVAENDGKVELYKHYVEGASQLELVDMNILGTNGFFEFTGVEPEEFYLRGIVTSANSIYDDIYTSYYIYGGDTTIWEGATALSIECEDTITNLNFVMYELTNTMTGPGVFSGTVTYGDGQAKLAGEPVPGAEVFIEQEPNDEPIANTTTDTSGTWNIDNIPVGTDYHIIVDIPGLPLVTTYTDIEVGGGDTINNDLNFFVDTLTGGGIFADTATIIIKLNSQNIEIKSYPNPVSNYFTIETELISNIDISYQVIDINGREIITKEIGNYQGRFIEQINMSNFENGVYFIKLKLDNTFYIKKIIKE